MVSETTETSITWTWNAVEGATAYLVQVSMNEMFGDEDDQTTITLMPTFTVSDIPPSTTLYLRVAAAIGTSVDDALVSPWTTHVTGVSNASQPPPPTVECATASISGRLVEYQPQAREPGCTDVYIFDISVETNDAASVLADFPS